MNVDITELLVFFDELMPATHEEQKVYWFKTTREDQITIIFIVDLFQESVDIIIKTPSIDIAGIGLKKCSEVKILDREKKCLEILHSNGRCFLALSGTSILDYSEKS